MSLHRLLYSISTRKRIYFSRCYPDERAARDSWLEVEVEWSAPDPSQESAFLGVSQKTTMTCWGTFTDVSELSADFEIVGKDAKSPIVVDSLVTVLRLRCRIN